jgi:hypothetical protein
MTRGELEFMARINIEDSLYKEQAFIDLVVATGSIEVALGALVRAWTVAQKYWVPDRKRIPRDVWDRERLRQAIIDSGLADENADGIYMRESDEQFSWLFQRSEAGKKPKRARQNDQESMFEQGESVDIGRSSVDDREESVDHRARSSYSSSFSSSPSISDSGSSSSSGEEEVNALARGSTPQPALFVEVWNSNRGELSKAKLTETRKKHIKQRIKEEPDLEYWTRVVRRIAESDFCCGRGAGGGTWVATIDWLLRPDTHVKVMEGKYDNRSGPRGGGPPTREQRITESNKAAYDAIDRGEF